VDEKVAMALLSGRNWVGRMGGERDSRWMDDVEDFEVLGSL
jgi:hypothetical protein